MRFLTGVRNDMLLGLHHMGRTSRQLLASYWKHKAIQTMASANQIFDPTKLAAFCARHGIRRLSLFGSERKGTAGPESDLDLLVEFEPDCKPGLIGMAELEFKLSGLAGGRKVDLRTAHDLSRYFREEIVQSAALLY